MTRDQFIQRAMAGLSHDFYMRVWGREPVTVTQLEWKCPICGQVFYGAQGGGEIYDHMTNYHQATQLELF